MLGYATIGVGDRDAANKFYDELFAMLGSKRIFNNDHMIFYGKDFEHSMVGVGAPWDKKAAGNGNGFMLALEAPSRAEVDKIYKKALELGATDEGEPGERGPMFYGGYFRDKDGNKFVVYEVTERAPDFLGYATIGVKDRDAAKTFYDELFAMFGAKQLFENDHMGFYGTDMHNINIGVGAPWDKKAASAGNGSMLALAADSREMVDEVYKKALELGASDEGEPGERGGGFYGAYFRDKDGNKFVVFKMG